MKTWNTGKKTARYSNNRINILIAIVFLLGIGIIAKLFYLQIYKYKYYNDVAAMQHISSKEVEANRGRIFIQDNNESGENKLYPIATNKEFALVYAKPNLLENPELFSRIFYFAFDKDRIKKEVDEMIAKKVKEMTKPPEGSTSTEYRKLTADEEKMLEEERKQEIKNLRDKKISEYFQKVNKPDDPYEPIAQKVEEAVLLKLYAMALSDPAQFAADEKGEDKPISIKVDEIKIKQEKIISATSTGSKDIEINIGGLGFTWKTYRYYPEGDIGSHILGYVSYANEIPKGSYGLEEFFNEELSGKNGYLTAERSAGGNLIIINDRQYTKPQNGSDLFLTIDRSIEFTACKKLNLAVQKHGADGGSLIIMDPKTGAILAMCGYPDFDPNNYSDTKDIKDFMNPAISSQYEPGSIFKVITMSMGLDQGKVTPETTYNDTGLVEVSGYKIENSDKKSNGIQTMTQVLEKSLNTGVIFVTDKVGYPTFRDYITNYGFGEIAGIELGSEAKGNVNQLDIKKGQKLYYYNASFGQGISVTPLQMVSAFAAIANQGILMKPYIVKEIVQENGEKITTQPKLIRRVISERAASLLSGMLVNVIENGHGKRAGVKGYWVGGKTGTAQIPRKDGRGYESGASIGSFAGYAPIDNPKFAMIVRLDHPRDVEWAESSAAPLFGDIAQFLLNYYKVPTTRKIEDKKK